MCRDILECIFVGVDKVFSQMTEISLRTMAQEAEAGILSRLTPSLWQLLHNPVSRLLRLHLGVDFSLPPATLGETIQEFCSCGCWKLFF